MAQTDFYLPCRNYLHLPFNGVFPGSGVSRFWAHHLYSNYSDHSLMTYPVSLVAILDLAQRDKNEVCPAIVASSYDSKPCYGESIQV